MQTLLMKRTITLLLLCIAFAGCIKNTCWKCESEQKITFSDGTPESVTTFTTPVCEYDYSMYEYERANSYSSTVVSSGVTMQVKVTTKCSSE